MDKKAHVGLSVNVYYFSEQPLYSGIPTTSSYRSPRRCITLPPSCHSAPRRAPLLRPVAVPALLLCPLPIDEALSRASFAYNHSCHYGRSAHVFLLLLVPLEDLLFVYFFQQFLLVLISYIFFLKHGNKRLFDNFLVVYLLD